MKKVFLLSVSLILLSGCSSELSPQEKRNKFDACVIRDIQENIDKSAESNAQMFVNRDLFNYDLYERMANNTCVKLLD